MTSNKMNFITPGAQDRIDDIVAYITAVGAATIPDMCRQFSRPKRSLEPYLRHIADTLGLIHRVKMKRQGSKGNPPTWWTLGPAEGQAVEIDPDDDNYRPTLKQYPLHHKRDELVSALFGQPQL